MELVYEIGKCVAKADLVLRDGLTAAYTKVGGTFRKINFQAGTLKEIAETLNDWSKSDTLRYEKMPIVCLLTPFEIASLAGSELPQAKFTLFTACATEPNLKRYQRQVKTFEPILNPIVTETIRQIIASHAFQAYELDVRYKLIEHDYWAKDRQKSIFNEYVDAVETRDFTINLSLSHCS